jgi:hypothetical protein
MPNGRQSSCLNKNKWDEGNPTGYGIFCIVVQGRVYVVPGDAP